MHNKIVYIPHEDRKTKQAHKGMPHFWFFAIPAILTVLAAIILLLLPYLRISHIEVILSGNTLSLEEIEREAALFFTGNYAGIVPRNLIFLASMDSVSYHLKNKFSHAEKVTTAKKYPHTLRISVAERDFFGIFCNEQKCAFLDKNGFAYNEAPNSSGYLIVKIRSDVKEFSIPSRVMEKELMDKMISLAEGLKKSMGEEAVEYEIFNEIPDEIRVRTASGFSIWLKHDDDDDFPNVFKILKIILEQEIKERKSELEYIDLRFGNKVFYKFKK